MPNSQKEDNKKEDCMGYDAEVDLIFADKTLEMLKLVEMTDLVMKEKFHSDPRYWTDAMFQVLMFRNSAYLWEERKQVSDDYVIYLELYDKLTKTYSELQEAKQGTDLSESCTYSNFMLMSSTLIKIFSKLSDLFVKEDNSSFLDFSALLKELNNIEKNVSKYLAKYDCDSNSYQKISDFNDAKENRDSFASSTSSSSTLSGSVPLLSTVANTSGSTAVDVTSSFLTAAKESSISLKCEDCDKTFVVFNNDKEFSRSLHTQDKAHKKALAAKWVELQYKTNKNLASLVKKVHKKSVIPESSTLNRTSFEDNKGEGGVESKILLHDLELSVRSTLDEQLGDQSQYICIISAQDFLCTICNCKVVNLQNVLPHVKGKSHIKLWEKHVQEFKSEIQDGPVIIKKNPVLQISNSTIPIKNLLNK